ncbi:isopenicillin N synthase family dioxygenase [Marinibactrum halimedae]|uniref:Oxidoreductase n=1 Tax=Marinibactrum halimedae TaxID=1444977 RepID=A0AA37T8A2_9GAMM|nr:2-oxoglutarate and iron-dependent oxygenase domain-containing protein [Marinibactrum halimedae]MCD9459665.1 hypothetical protein [Marinibactrum halimedae]GLS25691.1 oxidoreductase [Marinibactrum halimedae]
MTDSYGVPTLDLSQWGSESQSSFIQALMKGLETFGFVVIKNHGIQPSLLDKAYQQSKALFELDETEKLQYSIESSQRGYTAFGREHAKDNPIGDLKEYWHIGPELSEDSPYLNEYPKNFWPTSLPSFQPALSSLYAELDRVSQILLAAIGKGLNVEDGFFKQLTHDGNTVMRLIHYPPVENGAPTGAMRAAPHADINLITLLIGASSEGLELLDKNGEWLPINNAPDEIVVDTGDMMARLTNEQLPSTVHRVVNPKDLSQARYSMPFFVHPHNSASLVSLPQCLKGEPPKHEPITAGDFLHQRLRENGFLKESEDN